MLGMIISMKNRERLSLEQIRAFLEASEEFRFAASKRKEIYDWVTGTLVEHEYTGQGRSQGSVATVHQQDEGAEPGAGDAADRAVPAERDGAGALLSPVPGELIF